MKVSHILYKVDDLDEAVKSFTNEGFVVEYGKIKRPHNALIYFSEGPFLEIFKCSGMPRFFKFIFKMFGKKKFIEGLDRWDYAEEGLIAVCLENYKNNLAEEKTILDKYEQPYFSLKARRTDTKGRKLKYSCVFPDDQNLPFFMTYFSVDPKPKSFVHPNGVKGITSISFETKNKLIPLINELCDDSILKLYTGDGVKKLVYVKQ